MGVPTAPKSDQLKINIDSSKYQTKLPTLQDVQKEWGMTSPDKYAETIANANAQSQFDKINAQRDELKQGFNEGQRALDVDFFQQFRSQREENAIRGLNAGIEMQRNNQLDMKRQEVVGSMYRDYNREMADLSREERTVELQKQAQTLELRNSELQRQIDLAFKKGDFLSAENARRLQLDLQKEQQRIDSMMWTHEQNSNNYWKQQDMAMEQARLAEQKRQHAASLAQQQKALAQSQAESKMKQLEQAELKARQVSTIIASVKSGDTSPQDAQKVLQGMYAQGYFTGRDTDYKDAVLGINKAGYDYWSYDKKGIANYN